MDKNYLRFYFIYYDPGKQVEFTILSPMQIKKLSCVEITRPELYDADGYPVERGIVDPRMGVVDPGVVCRTCGSRLGECHGPLWAY